MNSISIPDCLLNSPPTVEVLCSWCEVNGFHVADQYIFQDPNLDAFYYHEGGIIYLARNLPTAWVAPTLAHEIVHAYNGHNGHQDQAIERRIDEAVAKAFVSPAEYAYWEDQYGWCTGGIAKELDLPRWVIEAYRRYLGKQPLTYLQEENCGIGIVA